MSKKEVHALAFDSDDDDENEEQHGEETFGSVSGSADLDLLEFIGEIDTGIANSLSADLLLSDVGLEDIQVKPEPMDHDFTPPDSRSSLSIESASLSPAAVKTEVLEFMEEDGEGVDEHDEGAVDGFDDEDLEDDEVVAEYDVHFSTHLSDNLYLFQYPTRPRSFKIESATSTSSSKDEEDDDEFDDEYEYGGGGRRSKKSKKKPDTSILQNAFGRLKPKSKLFEIEFGIETRGPHYNQEMGERLGMGLDANPLLSAFDLARQQEQQQQAQRQRSMLDRYTLSSSIVPMEANYFVGVVRDGALHLTPLAATIHMRPNLGYLDKISEKEKALSARINQEEKAAEEGGEVEEDAKMIQLQVRKAETKEEARKQAQAALQKQAEDEPWDNMLLCPSWSRESQQVFDTLVSTSDADVDVAMSGEGSSTAYLDGIQPKTSGSARQIEQVSRGLQLSDIVTLPLPKRLKALMLNANIIPFSEIIKHVDDIINNDEVGEEDAANPTGKERVVIAHLERVAVLVKGAWVVKSEFLYSGRALDARRYLLSLFHSASDKHGGGVSRKEFNDVARLTPEMAANMLAEIAFLDREREGPGGRKWFLKVKLDEEFLKTYPDVVARQKEVVERDGARAKEFMMGGKPKVVAPVKAEAGTSSSAQGSSSSGAGASAPGGGLLPTSEYPIQGKTPKEQMETLMKQLLLQHGVCSGEYLRKAVSARASMQGIPNNLLNPTTASETLITQIISTLCTQIYGGHYVLASLGNASVDEFRTHIINDLFRHKASVKKNDVAQVCLRKVSKEITTSTYGKIMKEVANSKGAIWKKEGL
ncbi:DNA-directed RNA polymerase III subunit RPC5 [Quaeritorhiza haematococci]|nr:DNA-directed RNA polymerase III subunit RPC5 [Quaeritorhiza haematococci]